MSNNLNDPLIFTEMKNTIPVANNLSDLPACTTKFLQEKDKLISKFMNKYTPKFTTLYDWDDRTSDVNPKEQETKPEGHQDAEIDAIKKNNVKWITIYFLMKMLYQLWVQ